MKEAIPLELPHLAKKSLDELPSNAASNYPGFKQTKGLKPEAEPEFEFGKLGAAVYEMHTIGIAHRLTQDALRSDVPQEEFDVFQFIPDRYLNEHDAWYLADAQSKEEMDSRVVKLDREKEQAAFTSNFPISYIGASLVAGIVDPINWAIPGSKIAMTSKQAYTAAKAGQAAMSVKALASAGLQTAALGAVAGSAQEILLHQTQISREISDSVYGVASGALLGGILGTIVPASISGYHYSKSQSQAANILAGNTPTPTKAPHNKLYAMDLATKAEMQGDDVISALPAITKKVMNISPAGRLRNSKSLMANVASSDLATNAFIADKNIVKNQASQVTVDELIAGYRGKARKTSADVNAIFMEQQGVSGLLSGVRSRIAEVKGRGLDRKSFSEQMHAVMESGVQSSHSSVNTAVTRVKNYLTEIKQELVDLDLLDKKFLEPEFDNYFTHNWLQPVLFRNHEDAKSLLFKWFNEVETFYKSNQEKLSPLNKRTEFAQREYDKAQRNLKRVVKSKSYKEFQTSKKAGTIARADRYERQVELEQRIAKFKKEIEVRKEALYKEIPAKYLTPGGFIPLGNKNPLELHSAVMQTFYRMTGSDVQSYMNPIVAGAQGNPNPLQMRLLTIPWDYSAQSFDGRTISASDFLSRDIWKMLDNYAGATSSVISFAKMAKARGLKDETELRAWYLKEIELDYEDMLKGKSGKEALDLNKDKLKDYRSLNNLFDQQHGISGKSFDVFGPGAARFVRRIRMYNSERMLGSAAISSLTDPFVAPFRQGIFNWAQDWLIPFAHQIVSFSKNKAIASNKRDIQDAGYAIETQIGMIAKKFYDNDDLLIESKWWHSLSEPVVNMFGNITGLSQVNDFVQGTAGHISISRTLRNIVKQIEKGNISKRDARRLRNVTISEESVPHIYEMWKERGGKDKGAYYSNHTQWNVNTDARAKAYNEFINSFQKDILHSTLRSSKSELPATYESLLGKVLFHFKDYLFAATQKLFLSGIQKIGLREYDVLLASTMMMASGSVIYVMQSLLKDPTGESLDLSPEKLLREGLDRSALLGIFMEPINMFQKQGWLPGQTVSRYYSRGILGNWVGPEIGTAQELAEALISPVIRQLKDEGNYTTKDALQILRLIPFQNLFYLRYLNEQVTKGIAESLGATPKD